jgi:hypothetical protein
MRPPRATVIVNNYEVAVDNLSSVPVAINTVYDDFSGFYGYYMTDNTTETVDNTTTFTQATNRNLDDNNTTTFSISESNRGDNQTIRLYVYLKDNAGNISEPSISNLQIPEDNTPPTLSSITVNDVGSGVANATYTDNETVQLTLTAYDNETGLVDWFARTNDNTTPSATESGWNQFNNDNLTVTYTLDNGTPGNPLLISNINAEHTIYAWVRDGGGNIVPDNITPPLIYDNITLDTYKPTLYDNITAVGTVPNATDPQSSGASRYDNTTAYSDNASVFAYSNNATISISLYFEDAESTYSTASRTFWYYITDNDTIPNPDLDNVSGGWLQLDNGTNLYDNTTAGIFNPLAQHDLRELVDDNYTQTVHYVLTGVDNRTVTVWVKDNATNVSDNRTFNIYLDNASPVAVGANTDNTTTILFDTGYNTSATNSRTVVIDNDTLFTDNLTGVARIILTDNASFVPTASDFDTLGRFHQGDTDNRTFTFNLSVKDKIGHPASSYAGGDNDSFMTAGDNLTLYYWAMDALGNVSGDNISSSIIFDNASPTDTTAHLIDESTNDNVSSNQTFTTDNQTFYINSATTIDNFSQTAALATDNTSLTYHIRDNNSTPTNSDSFRALNSFTLTVTDNTTIYVWARDNASNISSAALDTMSVVFDNTSPAITNVIVYDSCPAVTCTGAIDNSSDNLTDNATHNVAVMLGINFNDNLGANKYIVQQDNSTNPSITSTWKELPGSTVSGNSTTASGFIDNITGISFDNSSTSDNQTIFFYVWVMDNASNISSVGSDNITYRSDN